MNQTVHIHPSSSIFNAQPPAKVIMWFELVLTSREYARQVMEIKPEWLLEGAPSLLACSAARLLTAYHQLRRTSSSRPTSTH